MSDDFFSIELERDELNRYFGGGIPKNSLILFEGVDGAGKSVLCQRFIYGILKNSDLKISYISTEINTLDFIKQMESINYSIRGGILDGRLLFITMVPFLGKVKFEEDFIEKIMKSDSIFKSDVIIFDTLSFLLIKKNVGDAQMHEIINFLKKLNNLNKSVIITIDPTYLDDKFQALLKNVCDMYIHIDMKSNPEGTARIIDIKRFKRPHDVYVSKIPFRVEPKEGLIIEIGSYA
jgi:flagellar protein FlaH